MVHYMVIICCVLKGYETYNYRVIIHQLYGPLYGN